MQPQEMREAQIKRLVEAIKDPVMGPLVRSVLVMVPFRPSEGNHASITEAFTNWNGLGIESGLIRDYNGGFLEFMRSAMVSDFLAHSDKKFLIMLDNDMDPPLDLPYLLCRHQKPIVSGLCASIGGNGIFGCFSRKDANGVSRFANMQEVTLPARGILEADHVGTGAVCIRRDVLESFTWEPGDVPFHIPEDIRAEGARRRANLLGEDLAFCYQAKAKGFDIWVDCEARVGHLKPLTLFYDNVDPDLKPEDVQPFSEKGQQVGKYADRFSKRERAGSKAEAEGSRV